MPVSNSGDSLASVFEERAENLSKDELRGWTALTPRELKTIQKLKGPGAKLLTGPRGSGKSTLLKIAFFELAASKDAFPVYINYSKSLALEPLFHQRADALQLFRQWVLGKILDGAAQTFRDASKDIPEVLAAPAIRARNFIASCESGTISASDLTQFGPLEVIELLDSVALIFGSDRSVLLMDDAAHAFSQEQQLEFFEVFRELRSRRVACKAAVYPGITSYSPNVHVGHEAELIEAWSQPDDDAYLAGMHQLIQKRLPKEFRDQMDDRRDIVEYLALAAFGIPRAFINMLADVFDIDSSAAVKPTRLRAERAVASQALETRRLFNSLAKKLPRYSRFIELGTKLEQELINTLGQYNALQDRVDRKSTIVALEQPITPALQKILNMLEYAGVIRPAGEVSRGVKGRFSRYVVHFSLLLAGNALRLGKSYSLQQAVDALKSNHPHAFARTKGAKLLGADYVSRCVLDLPACQACGAPRVVEDQRFCMKCGTELTNVSLYQELLQVPVDVLGLPDKKLKGIREKSDISTIQDIILDDDLQQLRKIPWIGPVWANKIRTAALEFVGV